MTRLWMAIDGKKKAWNLPDRTVVVGGGEGAQIRVDRPGLAGRHCRIEPGPGGWRVVLLAEGEELLLNGRAIREGNLRHGDVVSVGDTELHFETEEAEIRRPAPRPAGPPPRRALAPPARRDAGRQRYEGARAPSGPRRRRAHGSQGLPGWAIVVLGLGGAALAIFLIVKVLSGTLVDVDLIIREAESMAKQGRLEEAQQYLQANRARIPAPSQDRVAALIQSYQEQLARRTAEARMRGEFQALAKFAETDGVKVNRSDFRIYELLYRADEFRRLNPGLPTEIEDAIRLWESTYGGVVDMRAQPPFEAVSQLIRGPIERTGSYKRFDLPLRRIQDFRSRFPSPVMLEQLRLHEEETLKYANMYGKRHVSDVDELIARGDTSFPRINQLLGELRWAVGAVALPEWEIKIQDALDRLLAYRDRLRETRDQQTGG